MTTQSGHVWDLVVIGGGSAGIVGAKTAASLGASVLLIERDRTGGDCLWTGCVPSKALIAAAHAAAAGRSSARLGVKVTGVDVDFAAVMAHVREAIHHIAPVDSVDALEAAGLQVLAGTARFEQGGTLAVDGQRISYRQVLLATGARPAIPPIPGLADVDYLTSDTLWDLDHAPGRLAVLGGGSIGCELGQAFARLGSDVTIIEGLPRILPREDPDASAAVHRALVDDGVRVLTGSPVSAVTGLADGSGRLTVGTGPDAEDVAFDRLVVAVGRTPRTSDLGLDAVGVERDPRGFVIVDAALRTTNRRVWAAGDLTGHPQFTHTAGVHGSLAASNAVLGIRRKVDLRAVPRVTFTDPEVAAVGSPTSIDDRATGVRVLTREHDLVDRAVAEADMGGFARVAVDGKSRIVGATVVGPRAGETLGELTLAVRKRMRTRDIAGTIHPYPTYSDGPWNAAIDDVQRSFESPGMQRAMGLLLKLRRASVRRQP
jgi:pyruvate/2-oxoglutarate dehydrogenase complex dihydrolipoamide dehydrogenase (E3) component